MAALEAQRVLTMFSTLLACFLIFLIARRLGASQGAAIIAALAFFFSPIVEPWAFVGRVDNLAVACELLGVYLFVRRASYLAVAMFVLAFFTKQMFAAGIASAVFYLLLNGEVRQAVRLGAIWALFVALITAALQLLYPYYWLNVWSTISIIYDFDAPLSMLGPVALMQFPLLALAAASLVIDGPKKSFAACFLIVSFMRDTASVVHWGSNSYYFMPTIAAAAIAAAPVLDRILQGSEKFAAPIKVTLGGVIAWLVIAQMSFLPLLKPYPDAPALDAPAMAGLQAVHGRVLTDVPDLAISDIDGIEPIELMTLNGMREHGSFDDRALIADINGRQIAAFALDGWLLRRGYRGRAFFWPDLRDAIERNYYLASPSGPPYILLPKPD
jgi:uncharacterized membrane protein